MLCVVCEREFCEYFEMREFCEYSEMRQFCEYSEMREFCEYSEMCAVCSDRESDVTQQGFLFLRYLLFVTFFLFF